MRNPTLSVGFYFFASVIRCRERGGENMPIRKLQTGRATSMPQGLFIGLVISIVTTLISISILAKMIEKEIISLQNIGYAIMPILLGAPFLGAYISAKQIKRQRLAVCLSSGVLYWLILFAITALFYGGKYEAVAITAALIMTGSLTAFLSSAPKAKHNKHRKINIRTR